MGRTGRRGFLAYIRGRSSLDRRQRDKNVISSIKHGGRTSAGYCAELGANSEWIWEIIRKVHSLENSGIRPFGNRPG